MGVLVHTLLTAWVCGCCMGYLGTYSIDCICGYVGAVWGILVHTLLTAYVGMWVLYGVSWCILY